jgi:hypothetical protein
MTAAFSPFGTLAKSRVLPGSAATIEFRREDPAVSVRFLKAKRRLAGLGGR